MHYNSSLHNDAMFACMHKTSSQLLQDTCTWKILYTCTKSHAILCLNCGKLSMQRHAWQAALYAVPEETCASRLGWICLYWQKKIPYLHGSISSCEHADSISQNAALLCYESQDFDFDARGMRMRIRTEPERRPAVLTTAYVISTRLCLVQVDLHMPLI